MVSEINKITLQNDDGNSNLQLSDEHAIYNIVQDRTFMANHCLRGVKKEARYALKQVQESSQDDAQTFINSIVDLAVEARFLAVVRHPNIIKMRAMVVTCPYSIDAPFFLVLDRLYDILGTRLTKWKKRKPKGITKLLDCGGKKETSFWVERLTVVYDLACALQYLHESK